MGFNVVKKQVLECLKNGSVLHQERVDIDVKNLLAVGQVSLNEVADIIGRASGNSYSSSPHLQVEEIEVHIIKTRHGGED